MFLPHRTYRDNEQNALTLGLLQEEGMTNRMFENYIFDRDTLYDGRISSSRIVCRIKNGYLYRGDSTSSSRIIGLVKDGKIYEGNIASSSHLKGFLRGNAIYAGSVPSSNAIVLIEKNGDLYLGRNTYSSARIEAIEGTETMDLAMLAAMIHFFIMPILNR